MSSRPRVSRCIRWTSGQMALAALSRVSSCMPFGQVDQLSLSVISNALRGAASSPYARTGVKHRAQNATPRQARNQPRSGETKQRHRRPSPLALPKTTLDLHEFNIHPPALRCERQVPFQLFFLGCIRLNMLSRATAERHDAYRFRSALKPLASPLVGS